MADHERRCLPPCQRQLSDEDLHAFCFVCLGEEHANSRARGRVRALRSPLDQGASRSSRLL